MKSKSSDSRAPITGSLGPYKFILADDAAWSGRRVILTRAHGDDTVDSWRLPASMLADYCAPLLMDLRKENRELRAKLEACGQILADIAHITAGHLR